MPPVPRGSGYFLIQTAAVLSEAVYWLSHTLFSLFVVFIRATDAVAAALAGQRALAAEDWGDIGPLRVRMAPELARPGCLPRRLSPC